MKRFLSLLTLFLGVLLFLRLEMNETRLAVAQTERTRTQPYSVSDDTQKPEILQNQLVKNLEQSNEHASFDTHSKNHNEDSLCFPLESTGENNIDYVRQDPLTQTDWLAFYNNRSMTWDIPVDLIESSQGGFLAVGQTLVPGSRAPDALWVLKLTNTGVIEWERTYLDGNGRVSAQGVIDVEDGYLILASEGSVSGEILLKIGYDGSITWMKDYTIDDAQSGDDWYSIDKSSSGVVVGGKYNSLPSLSEIDNNGVVLRSRTFNHSYQEGSREIRSNGDVKDVVILDNGQVFITGKIRFNGGDWYTYREEVWYALLDEEWNVLWEKSTGLPNLSSLEFDYIYDNNAFSDSGEKAIATRDGGFLIVARHNDGWSDDGNFWVIGSHASLIKVSSDGSIAWDRVYFGDESKSRFPSTLTDIVEADDGYIGIGVNHNGRWMIKITDDGDITQEQIYERTSLSDLVTIATSSGNYASLIGLSRPTESNQNNQDLALFSSSDGMFPSCVELNSEFSPSEIHTGTLNPPAPTSARGELTITVGDIDSNQFDDKPANVSYGFICGEVNSNIYSISGRVIDKNEAGIEGVTVSTNEASAVTNSNGDYIITGLANGDYTLTPSKTGYTFSPASRSVTIQDGNVTAPDLFGTRLESDTYSISGRVRDNNATGIGSVTIFAGSASATTDSNGNYTISGLANGNYILTPSKEGYTFEPTSRSVIVQGADVTGQDFVGTTLQSDTYSISGQVRDNNGTSLSNITIQLQGTDGERTTTTDSNGNYTFNGLVAGRYLLAPIDSRYTFEPSSHLVDLPPSANGQDFVGTAIPEPGDPPPAQPVGEPLVDQVQACIGGPYYFKPWLGSPMNQYRATVDWQGLTPDSVDFSLNGRTNTVSTSSNNAAYAYNLRDDLNYLVVGQRNVIRVQANAANGVTSDLYTLNATGIDIPYWLPADEMEQSIPLACTGEPMKASWTILYPEEPFEAEATPPDWFPYVGGKSLGLPPTQAGANIEFAGDGEGSAKLFGQTGFQIADQPFDGRLYGKGEGRIDEGGGIHLNNVSFGGEIEGEIKAQEKVLDIICNSLTSGNCPLKEAENIIVVGNIVKWFNNLAQLEAKFKPAIDFALNFHSQPSGLEWKRGESEGKLGITLGLIFEVYQDGLSAEAYGGGEGKLTVQTPANPSYLKEIALELLAGIKVKVWRWKRTFEQPYQWSYEPGLRVPERQNSVLMSTDWQPIPRTYASRATEYAHFRANERPLRLGVPLMTPLMPTDEHLIASNVFPDGHPAIAADSSVLMLWVHDDVDKPIMQGEEIQYSLYDGAVWSTPAGITSDNLQDFAPQVAFDGNGNAIAVWERNKTIQSETTAFDADYTNAFELAYAVWDGTSWSTPTYLTDNEALDHAPVLVRGGDGNLLLLWRQNAAGELLGTASAPDTIYYTMWNGTTWTSSQVLLDNASGIVGITAARHNANTQSVVYTRDTDGDLATADDQDLFVQHWNGNTWGSAEQLTSDTEPDNSPTLFYDGNGAPHLLWLKRDTLTALVGSLSGTPQPIALESSSTVLGYEATQDASGNLALVWQDYSNEGVDVFYATYDEAHGVFGLVQQLTHDESLEKFMAPVFAPTGEMVMAYNETTLITETVTVSDTLQIDNVTKFGQTDLYVLTHAFGSDLTVSEITVTPANPAPGSTAQVNMTLYNKGDRAVENPELTLYLGNPTAGGTSINASTANLTLAGGMTTTLPIEWNVPSNGDTFALYAVADPDNKVNELDETNNMAQIVGSAPDLVVERVGVSYGQTELITLTATISNTGVVAAPAFKVDFRLDDPITGTLIATTNATSLAAGNNRDMQTTWDASSVAMGNYKVYAVIDSDERIAEADETNNTDWAGLAILPDLELRSSAVQTGTRADGSQIVSVWLFNTGSREAQNVTLGLYDQIPTANSTPLVSETIYVPAGGYPVTTFNLSTALPGFYIGAGIGDGTADRDSSNNILLIGEPAHNLYLPAVLR